MTEVISVKIQTWFCTQLWVGGERREFLSIREAWRGGGMGKAEKQLSFEAFGFRLGILICAFDLITHSRLEDYSSNIQVLK